MSVQSYIVMTLGEITEGMGVEIEEDQGLSSGRTSEEPGY